MPSKTAEGTLLIREETVVPGAVRLETESFAPGWRLVINLDRRGLDRQIRGAGWNFFCMAGEIQATAFGRKGQDGVYRAVKRILAKLKSPEFNSLEITGVVSKRFLGVPCTNVHARSRHIQESIFLVRTNDVRSGAKQGWRPAEPRLLRRATAEDLTREQTPKLDVATPLNL